jgi:hypothetical protein
MDLKKLKEKIATLTLTLYSSISYSDPNMAPGYQQLIFGQGFEESKEILTSTCESVTADKNKLSGRKCFEIAGKKRNITAFFYESSNTLSQIQIDFIKDDMIFKADRSVAKNIVDGLSKKYSLDREVYKNGNNVLSFSHSSVVLIFGNTWNALLSMNTPTFLLVYSDPATSKKMETRFGISEPNLNQY